MWLIDLKVAVIEKDFEKLSKIMDDVPTLEDAKERTEALYFLKEASKIVQELRDNTKSSMEQIQKNIKFLNSAVADKTSKFDVSY